LTNSNNPLRLTKNKHDSLFNLINSKDSSVFDDCDVTNSRSFLTITGGDIANFLGIEIHSNATLTNHSALLGGRITDEMEIPI